MQLQALVPPPRNLTLRGLNIQGGQGQLTKDTHLTLEKQSDKTVKGIVYTIQ